jgi:hypothetical protein
MVAQRQLAALHGAARAKALVNADFSANLPRGNGCSRVSRGLLWCAAAGGQSRPPHLVHRERP